MLWQAALRLSHSNWSIISTIEFTSKAQRNFPQLNSKFSRCQFLPLRCRFHCCVPPTIRRWVPVSVLSVPLPETPFPSLLMASCYHQPVKGALLLELYEYLIYVAMGHNTWHPVKTKYQDLRFFILQNMVNNCFRQRYMIHSHIFNIFGNFLKQKFKEIP